MQQPDATTELPSSPAASGERSCPTIWIVGITLAAVTLGRYPGFKYPHYLGAIVFQCGLMALLLAWAWQGPRRHAAPSWDRMLLVSYAVLSAGSCLWAEHTRSSAIGAIPVLFPITWALLLGAMLRDRNSIRFIARAIFLAGAVAAGLAVFHVLQSLDPDFVEQSLEHRNSLLIFLRSRNLDAVERVLGHRNFLAIFLLPPLLLGIADLHAWIVARLKRLDTSLGKHDVLGLAPALVIAGLVAMLGALALCSSAGAILGLGMGVLTLYAMRLSKRARLALILVIVFLGAAGLIALSLPPVTKRLLEERPSQATRLYLWRGSVRMILQRPIFGWGTGMFQSHFTDFKPTEPMRYGLLTDMTLHPHNEWLLVAVEGGIVALALYLGGLFAAARRYVAAVDSESDPGARTLPWALFAGFVAMTVQGLVSVSLRFWGPSTLYWTLAGILLAFPFIKRSPSATGKPNASHALLRIAAMVVPVAAITWGVIWSGARAELLFNTEANGQKLSSEEHSRRMAEAAVRSRYLPDRYRAMRQRVLALRKFKDLDGAIAVCEALEREAHGLGTTRTMLAELYYQRAKKIGQETGGGIEDLQRAAEILDRALGQNPFDPNAHVKYAKVAMLLSSRNLPVALDHAKKAVEIDARNAFANMTLGQLLADNGEKAAALKALDRAEALCREKDAEILAEIREARRRAMRIPSRPAPL